MSYSISPGSAHDAHSTQQTPSRPPLILVCGPWGSGTSATAGSLIAAGAPAPKPWVVIKDELTPVTAEFVAFRKAMVTVIDEPQLKKIAARDQILDLLRAFRDAPLAHARRELGVSEQQPLLLKHALSILLLPELSEIFDVRIIGVLRPLREIEATRQRRNLPPVYGAAGAKVLYSNLLSYLLDSRLPFELVRYRDLLDEPETILPRLVDFCGISMTPAAHNEAIGFLRR